VICQVLVFVIIMHAFVVPPTLPGVHTVCQPGSPPTNLSSLSPKPGSSTMKNKANHYIYKIEAIFNNPNIQQNY
jgi:hypothetical protein